MGVAKITTPTKHNISDYIYFTIDSLSAADSQSFNVIKELLIIDLFFGTVVD